MIIKTLAILLGEHPCIMNIFLGPVTVHYREVLLYRKTEPHYIIGLIVMVCQTWYFVLNVIICHFFGWRYGFVDNYSLF